MNIKWNKWKQLCAGMLAAVMLSGCSLSGTTSTDSAETLVDTSLASQEEILEQEISEEVVSEEAISEEETSEEETSKEEVSGEEISEEASGEEAEISGDIPNTEEISEDGTYSSKQEVAEYIHLYGHLPSNYLTKQEAEALGWDNSKGNLWDVAPGMSIGGNKFGNYEGLLPKSSNRQYYECDIDYEGGYRNAKRIIYSNDGLIYYTEDHYASFECLYEN